MGDRQTTTAAAVRAFADFRSFNRQRISQRAGVVAAIPVAAMLSLGLLIADPTDSVIMGVGAMLVGVAWRAGDGPQAPPVGTMLAAAVMLAVATMVGTLSGHWEWLHLIVLAGFCLLAGVATSLGRGGVLVGTQTIIAFVVFGRFPENLANALGLAGLVFAGGAAQLLFAISVGLPLAWRRQRAALASAYLELAGLAGEIMRPSAPAAAALDAANSVLDAPALFADPELHLLGELAATGRRIRLELIVIGAALGGLHGDGAADTQRQAELALGRVRGTLTMIVAAIEGVPQASERVLAEAQRLGDWAAARPALSDARVDERIAALNGQVAAAARAAGALHEPGDGRPGRLAPTGRPAPGHLLRRGALRDGVQRMRENATLDSAAGRHALRLALTVAGVELLTQLTDLPRGYWAVVAAATVLRPEFGATFTRGAERMLGTLAGVVIASLIAVLIDPSGWGLVCVVALLSYATYALFPASFTLGVAMLTAVIVFVLHVAVADTIQTALDRGLDTVIGGVIGLAAYALWPTWSSLSSARLLANLIDSHRDYLQAVLAALSAGGQTDPAILPALARRARIAWTDAQCGAELVASEPHRGEIDPGALAATLDALRRVVYGVHALRLEAVAVPPPVLTPTTPVPPPLAELGEGLRTALELQASFLRTGRATEPPPLRALYRAVDWPARSEATQALRPAFDELVDAVDTASAALGLESQNRNIGSYDGFQPSTS